RHVRQELGRELAFEIEVRADVAATMVARVTWREAGKDRRTSRRQAAARGAVLGKMPTIDPRRALSRCDLEALAPHGHTERDVDRRRETELHGLRDVDRADGLHPLEPAGEERELIRDSRIVRRAEHAVGTRRARHIETRAERRIQRVPQVVVEAIAAERSTCIERPAAHDPPEPRDPGIIADVGVKLGKKALRVDLRPVPLAVEIAPETVAGARAMA